MLGGMHLEERLVLALVRSTACQILSDTEVCVVKGIPFPFFWMMLQIFKVFNQQLAEVFRENFISTFPWRVPFMLFFLRKRPKFMLLFVMNVETYYSNFPVS